MSSLVSLSGEERRKESSSSPLVPFLPFWLALLAVVTLEDVKTHLLLVHIPASSSSLSRTIDLPSADLLASLISFFQLGAFDSLKHHIVSLPSDPEVAKIEPPLDNDAKWALFVKRAAWRFEQFWVGLERARESEGAGVGFREEELPPLG